MWQSKLFKRYTNLELWTMKGFGLIKVCLPRGFTVPPTLRGHKTSLDNAESRKIGGWIIEIILYNKLINLV